MQFFRRAPTADLPRSFGYKMCWLAIRSSDSQAVSKALGLKGVKDSTWKTGLEEAETSSVFVTPPLKRWVLVAGISLAPPDDISDFVKPLIERLSSSFGEAQYFCTHRVVEMHVWARAINGRLSRGFAYVGEGGETKWNEGGWSRAEQDLGFNFFDGQLPEAEQPDYWDRKDLSYPTEDKVMRLAAVWSIDPTTLEEDFHEPSLGLAGKFSR